MEEEVREDAFDGEIVVTYLRSPLCRTIHVDGITGGPRPDGSGLAFSLFNERVQLPQKEVLRVVNGRAAGTSQREGDTGLLREIDIGCVLSLEMAESMGKWLLQQVEKARGTSGNG